MRFIIVHGTNGNPNENWFPWLKEELEKQSEEVFVPEFPTPKYQSLNNWMDFFEPYSSKIDENTVLIGYGLGTAFILSVLEKTNVKVKACFFVAGFIGQTGIEEYDELNKSFIDKKFDWEKIKQNCDQFVLLQSDNDPYISLEKAQEFSTSLGVEPKIIKGAGHFNKASGYETFPELLKILKSLKKADSK